MPNIGGAKGNRTQVTNLQVTSPLNKRVPMATANTEYSYALPANTIRWRVKNIGNDMVEMAYSSFSGTPDTYPVYPWEYDEEKNINPTASITLYFRSTSAGQEMVVRTWT